MSKHIAKVMEDLAKVFGEDKVLLAGGAVRDHLNGREIKDYDIFILNHMHVKLEASIINLLGSDYTIRKHVRYASKYKHPMVVTTFDINYKHKMEPLNLIFVKHGNTKGTILNSFEIGLCVCWLDLHTGKFVTTPRYDRDLKDKQLTVKLPKSSTPQQLAVTFNDHVQRVKAKYDWPIRLEYR